MRTSCDQDQVCRAMSLECPCARIATRKDELRADELLFACLCLARRFSHGGDAVAIRITQAVINPFRANAREISSKRKEIALEYRSRGLISLDFLETPGVLEAFRLRADSNWTSNVTWALDRKNIFNDLELDQLILLVGYSQSPHCRTPPHSYCKIYCLETMSSFSWN